MQNLALWTLAVVILFPPASRAQEWTRFRGPNGSGLGQAANLPAQFLEKDFAWKIQLPGSGHSSPVLWGQRLFITCADADAAKLMILCVNAGDGSIRWQRAYAVPPHRMNADNSYASATPAVDGQRLYLCFTSPESCALLALDHEGKEVWKQDLGPYKARHGGGTSPILFEDLVILVNDQEGGESSILALDAKTGRQRWKLPRKSDTATYGAPCIRQPAGQEPELIVSSRSEGIVGIDARSGRRLWQLPDAMDSRVVASPIVVGELVAANCGEGGRGHLLVVAKPGSADQPASTAYRITVNPPYVPTPLCKDDLLFTWTDAGLVSCLEASTGKTIWQHRLNVPFYSSPVCDGERLYNISRKGEVFVMAAGREATLLGRSNLDEATHATPAIANGRLYLRTYTHLICVGPVK